MGDRKVKKKKEGEKSLVDSCGGGLKGRVDGEEDGGCHYFSSTV